MAYADACMLEAMVSLGRNLHLDTLAERIEPPEQRDTLSALGCVLGQGFYFARPLEEPDVEALLRRDAERRSAAYPLPASA